VKVRAQRIKPEKAFLASLERAQVNTHELLDVVTKAISGGSE
jgi:hypothetical protein